MAPAPKGGQEGVNGEMSIWLPDKNPAAKPGGSGQCIIPVETASKLGLELSTHCLQEGAAQG